MGHALGERPPLPPARPVPLTGPNVLQRLDRAWRASTDALEMQVVAARISRRLHPPLPESSGEGRRVVYSNGRQWVWLVEGDGTITASHPVSGRRGVPVPDTYEVFSESELAWAGHDGITMQYMVRFTHGSDLPIGFHSIPVDPSGEPIQTEEDLGSFRSAGCVRQALADAERLYHWAGVGTTVVVTP